ncbi:MAG: universal stress protein [Propionibacteriales bacterium]|nr:universal stress protein [Propionibacteriales bacterium]
MREASPRVPRPRASPDRSSIPVRIREHLVVGVDGSPASVGALAWALRHAADHDCTLEVITAWPLGSAVFVHEVPGHFSEARWKAVQAQAQAMAYVKSLVEVAPPYTSRIENAPALDALVDAATRGHLLVLGSDRDPTGAGADEFTVPHLPLTTRVQRLATCPVVLIPHELDLDVDEQPHADQASVTEPPATVG